MQRVYVLILRINAVACEAAAHPVGAVVHHGDGADYLVPRYVLPVLSENPGDSAAGGNANPAFLQSVFHALFRLSPAPAGS